MRRLGVLASQCLHSGPFAPKGIRLLSGTVASAAEPLVACRIDEEKRLAIITLNDPKRLNALTVDMGNELMNVVSNVKDRAAAGTVLAVVLTGAGRAFSAGGDLAWLKERTEVAKTRPIANSTTMLDFYRRFLCIRSLPVPVVAAVDGPAIGAGACLALACDYRVASEAAKIGFTFVGLGIHPGMAATQYVRTVVGPQVAARLLLTGDVVSGKEAVSLGLVGELVKEDALKAAIAMAGRMAAQSPVAVQSCVASLRAQQDASGIGLNAALQREADCQAISYGSADIHEGLAAVASKRTPSFS